MVYRKDNNIKHHFIYLFILYLYYLFPLTFTGSLLAGGPDVLDGGAVYNFIAGKIILGNTDAVKVFLGGELPWQFLKGVFYPITFIYSFFEVEKSFWITDILLRTLAYFSFFYLLQKFSKNSSLNFLLALLFASSIPSTLNGIGLVTIPYLAGLLLKQKKLKSKNFLTIFFIGLNTDLYLHGIYVVPILFFLFFIFNNESKKKYSKNLISIIFLYFIAVTISNSQIIYSIIYLRPFHNEEIIREIPNLLVNFKQFFVFLYGEVNPYFFMNIFIIILQVIIYFFSFFKKNKTNIYILLIILGTSFLNFILNIEFINELRSKFLFLNSINFNRFNQFYYFLYTICLFFIFQNMKFKLRPYLVLLIVLSIFYNITSLNLKTITANYFNYYHLEQKQKKIIQNNYNNYQYVRLFQNLKKFKEDRFVDKNIAINSFTSSSFDSYYQFENYKFIKNIVKNNKILSIGLDPMKAAMSNINIVDGYYYLYPLVYKKKFEKIYSDKGRKHLDYKNFYKWGHRIQVLSTDLDLINLQAIKMIGSNYILTNKIIESNLLTKVCLNCNNAVDFNLYKIK